MSSIVIRYFGWCAKRAISREKPRVIIVAGSVGKTTTKEAIGVAIGARESGTTVRVAPENYNNELGVPLTIFGKKAPGRSLVSWLIVLIRATSLGFGLGKIGAKTLVLEYATDRPGDIAYLLTIARPDIAVITAIGAEHTEYFHTIDAVQEEELSLLKGLGEDGIAVLNADDVRVMQGAEMSAGKVITFGETVGADVRLERMKQETEGIEVRYVSLAHAVTFHLNGVFGRPPALAVAVSLAVVYYHLDVDLGEVVERLKMQFHGVPGRARLLPGIKQTILMDDSYNSSPLAVMSAVHDLAELPIEERSKRIAALGDMLELGPLSDSAHEELGEAVAKNKVDILVLCGTLAPAVREGAIRAGMDENTIFHFPKSEEAGLFIQHKMKKGDVVLIKGSQGVRMEKISKELMAEPEKAKDLLCRQSAKWI
ncbi:MAG: UDP-N-acetylmuramoyl-tripeptide--D-alanyl-D-alanine ligase [bacterium]|nr:UDP-N-acetylmuramoyl-tripeptide--D-alanyl-D-alanine ligase [bacterium]